jgi:integrative and conjugative element protein (TIGR02256 family)
MRHELHLATDHLDLMLEQGRRHYPAESGGVLLGHQDGPAIHVTHLIGPGPHGQHHRAWFHPDTAWQQARIEDLYAAGCSHDYLGDWHLHPTTSPVPSRLDLSTLNTIATTPAARCPAPVMAILGRHRGHRQLRAYQHHPRRGLRELTVRLDATRTVDGRLSGAPTTGVAADDSSLLCGPSLAKSPPSKTVVGFHRSRPTA